VSNTHQSKLSTSPSSPAVNAWQPDVVEALYAQWKADPSSVDQGWQTFFMGFDLGVARPLAPQAERGAAKPTATTQPTATAQAPVAATAAPAVGQEGAQSAVDELIRRYRELGHRCAALDPLGTTRPFDSALSLEAVGLDDSHLEQSFSAGSLPLTDPSPLGSILELLEETYCRSIGAEVMHIRDLEERAWLLRTMEGVRNQPTLSAEQRRRIFEQLARADRLEAFMATRYVGKKRFGLEGSESVVPAIERVVELASANGATDMTLAMAHRGRVNVLANVVGKPYEQVLTEFEDSCPVTFVNGGGDVKYHQGYSSVREFGDGRHLHIRLCPNPSHLEYVNALALGRTRALQEQAGEDGTDRVVPLLLHGDAAFPGQGSLAECFNLMALRGYAVGGALHLVINNQVGFTTDPCDLWTGEYCTDMARGYDLPVFHVNGDDPEACVWAMELAFEYRRTFRKDAVVDLWCYRKNGHNETDEPSFTQPTLYQRVRATVPVMESYAARLEREGVLEAGQSKAFGELIFSALDAAQATVRAAAVAVGNPAFQGRWKEFRHEYAPTLVKTAVDAKTLARVSDAIGSVPEGFQPHKTVARVLTARSTFDLEKPIDWAQAELLAYGTLGLEGYSLRLSGQDSERGTFSHRHMVLSSQDDGRKHNVFEPLRGKGVGRLEVVNSPLTENACLSFELGFSQVDPRTLVIWEAQFGDFANGAQVMIDQFIVPGLAKWHRTTGLTLFLPHGFEGQGPEHSSARIERFLQQYAAGNMLVCYPSTTAQMFHLLRRQMLAPWRRPLIIFTPKSMLRLPAAQSPGASFVDGSFQTVIDDPAVKRSSAIKHVHLCTGKYFHELAQSRSEGGHSGHALVRVEQLAPFPAAELKRVLGRYPGASVGWVQEEPLNMGAATFVRDRMEDLTGNSIRRIGRPASASIAAGSQKVHAKQAQALLDEIFSGTASSQVAKRQPSNPRTRAPQPARAKEGAKNSTKNSTKKGAKKGAKSGRRR